METWKPIPGWLDFYEVSDQGRVKSVDRKVAVVRPESGKIWWKPVRSRILKLVTNSKNGYVYAGLRRNGKGYPYSVHRLVLEAHVGPGLGLDAMHLDNDRTNNSLENLRWGTRSENIQQCWDEERREPAGFCLPK